MRIDTGDRRLLALNGAGAATCVAIAVLFCACGLRPILGRAAAATVARHRLEAAVSQRDALDAAVRDETDRLRALRKEMAATALVLEPPSKVNDLLARVAAVAAATGVRLDDVRVGKLVVGDRYDTLPVHAVGRGTFGDCVRFLHRLNHDCPDTAVAAFGLSGAAGEVGVELDLRWHTALPVGP